MTNNIIFRVILTFLALLTGYMLSAISLVGRIGIGLFYHEYRFLKDWWKGALLVYIIWNILFIVHALLRKRMKPSKYTIVSIISITLALIGLFQSFVDFRHTLSHRWLGEPFHLGVYLFWIVWVAIVIYVSWQYKPRLAAANDKAIN